MKNPKEIKPCGKCGKKLKKLETGLKVRTESSRPDDPYDGDYDNIYIYFCPCWKNYIKQKQVKKTTAQCAMPVVKPRFDIEREDFYEYNKPKDRTRKRLTEIAECGMEETGIASFGYKGVMSGLYIERVWSDSDKIFADYMQWAKGLIAASLNGA